tara:strand:+ start:5431 stop:6282 length:852 start_codon:yes stop_codon:yes gene_type:complete
MQTQTKLEITPIASALGAEIKGANLADDHAPELIQDIRQALLDNCVIFFRDQELTPDQLVRFAKKFGSLDEHDFIHGMPDYPEVLRLVKEADEGGYNFGGGWHTDVSYMEKPSLGSLLYAVDIPLIGGDTLFANQYLAYETLTDAMKEMLDGLNCIHSALGIFDPKGVARDHFKNMNMNPNNKAEEEVAHPVVRTHPETGRKSLYVNVNFCKRLQGMTNEESQPILKFLFEHGRREIFTCRFQWKKGSVAFWDNRCVQHHALNDYQGHRREMYRVTISGDRPI